MLKYIVVSLSIMKSSVKLFRPQYANDIFDDTENGDSFFCNTSMALWLYGSMALRLHGCARMKIQGIRANASSFLGSLSYHIVTSLLMGR